MPTIDTLHELLKHELKDLYSAEIQIIDALPGMVQAAADTELKNALQQHLAVSKVQKKRLEEVQKLLGDENAVPEKKGFFANLFTSNEGEQHCKALEGLVKEANSLLREDMKPEVMDAAIIAATQKIEHYEISSYGTARAFALQLQFEEVANLLSQTLQEEYDADDALTALAISKINLEAEPALGQENMLSEERSKPASRKAVNKNAPKKVAKKSKAASPKKSASKSKAAKRK